MNRLALVFPGQGAQYIGMGKDFYEKYDVAKKVYTTANEILGFDLSHLCFEGDIEELNQTEKLQLALFTTSMAMYEVFKQEVGVEPYYCMGHSLGEYAALCASGALSFEDALHIVYRRGKLMQSVAYSKEVGMTAITNIDKEIIENVCRNISTEDEKVVIAAYNSNKQVTISGYKKGIEKVVKQLKDLGANAIDLKVKGSFHSFFMKDIADQLKETLDKYPFKAMNCEVISNVTGQPYKDEFDIKNKLASQLYNPVDWRRGLQYLYNNGINCILEMGPGHVLKKLSIKNNKWIEAYTYDENDDRMKFIDSYHPSQDKIKFISQCMAIAVCLKNYNSDEESYRDYVVNSYSEIETMYNQLEANGEEPSIEQLKKAFDMLNIVFSIKKTPAGERNIRMKQLFNNISIKKDLGYTLLPEI